MSHEHKATIRRVYEEILNAGDLELVREIVASEAVDHAQPSLSSLPVGETDGIEDFLGELCTAFPDAYWTIKELDEDLDTVIAWTTVSGNHHGEFRGWRATGRQFTLNGVDIFRISNGKIVEHWGELDVTALQRQLALSADRATQRDRRSAETP